MASLTGIYYGSIETPAHVTLDSYTLLGLVLQYDIDTHWRVALSASNVLDEDYRTFTARYNTTRGNFSDGMPGEGAQQLLTLSYRF
jgi:outer membrane receptor protein involved in Fe transport